MSRLTGIGDPQYDNEVKQLWTSYHRWTAFAVLTACFCTGCIVDFSSVGKPDSTVSADGAQPDGAVITDGEAADGSAGDGTADGFSADGAINDGVADDGAMGDSQTPDGQPVCDPDECPLGCHPSENRCNRIEPSNYSTTDFHDAISAGLELSSDEHVVVNTQNGSIEGDETYRQAGAPGDVRQGIYFDVVSQVDGPELAVIGVRFIDVAQTATIEISGERAVAFYVVEDVSLAGIIEAKAQNRAPGPGGRAGGYSNGDDGAPCGAGGAGIGGAQDPAYPVESGGGGGANGGTGGRGGNVDYNGYQVDGGWGGAPLGNAALIPLQGGCGGGAGGGPDPNGNNGLGGDGGSGGGGGGAVQITAGGSIEIVVGGGIDVGGGGGQGGQYGGGGGGGGAGGSILLEGASVQNNGLLAANGGGGGAGGENTDYPQSENGMSGAFAHTTAAGGNGMFGEGGLCSGVTCYGGDGGGGAGATAQHGGDGVDEGANTGGGGGGGGRIRINYAHTLYQGLVSPVNASTHQGLSTW
jgi:hypothetical protein